MKEQKQIESLDQNYAVGGGKKGIEALRESKQQLPSLGAGDDDGYAGDDMSRSHSPKEAMK